MKLAWEIDEFNPCSGQRSQGIKVDHTAWLRCRREGARSAFMSINLDSNVFSDKQAEQLLLGMINGLNAVDLSKED